MDIIRASGGTKKSYGTAEENSQEWNMSHSKGENAEMQLVNELMTVYDEADGETVEISVADVDNLLVLFFHTKSMEAFNLVLKLVHNGAIAGEYSDNACFTNVLLSFWNYTIHVNI